MVDISDQGVGEGWWEGSVNGGAPGLLPASYVELTGDAPAAAPAPAAVPAPPPAPPAEDEEDDDGEFSDDGEDDGWEDDADDDYGDDDDDDGPPRQGSAGGGAVPRPAAAAGGGGAAHIHGRSGTLKKSTRFRASAYASSGAEQYMRGVDTKRRPPVMLTVGITKGQGPGWEWPGGDDDVRVSLGDKNKGTFSSKQMFNVTYNGFTVQRRMKHFQWLHEQLVLKYTCVCVPPLPDKTFNPKFGEKAEEKRKAKLQAWLRRILRHPVLRQDQASLKHFLECIYQSHSRKSGPWKKGKKIAQDDAKMWGGANFFLTVDSGIPCPRDAIKTIDAFNAYVKDMSKAANECIHKSSQHSARMAGAIRKEYQMIGSGYSALAKVCVKANGADGDATKLSMALDNAAQKMEECATIVKTQPARDELPWIDGLKEYTGMLSQFGDATSSSRDAERAVKAATAGEANAEIDPKEEAMLRGRLERIHTVTLCEMHHFQESLKKDMKAMMQAYFQAQIDYHQSLINQLEAAKMGFDKLPF